MRVLCRRTTPDDFGRNRWADISIHVLHAEDDCFGCSLASPETHFNPRPPCGGRPCHRKCCRSPRRISIHVLRVEDDRHAQDAGAHVLISIPVLRVEDDKAVRALLDVDALFQSTSSVWRTTVGWHKGRACYAISIHVLRVEDDAVLRSPLTDAMNFNPRPPCGGRQRLRRGSSSRCAISIHVLRVEDDWAVCLTLLPLVISIHVLRVEDDTNDYFVVGDSPVISIHVLRVEDDHLTLVITLSLGYFNPRPPCGGRLLRQFNHILHRHFNPRPPCGGRRVLSGMIRTRIQFQSTSSVWRTTNLRKPDSFFLVISIHVLRVEDDNNYSQYTIDKGDFNPRPPCGGRLSLRTTLPAHDIISIHVLRVEDDKGWYL